MLFILSPTSKKIENSASSIAKDSIWYDLVNPQPDEIQSIESALHIHIPSLNEMQQIEESSRLYKENGSLYMIAILMTDADGEHCITMPVAFIMRDKKLITVRYSENKSFSNFIKKIDKNDLEDAEAVFLSLSDEIVESIADIIEKNTAKINQISQEIFRKKKRRSKDSLHHVIMQIGINGDLSAKIQESLESFNMLLIFYENQIEKKNEKALSRVQVLERDIKMMIDHVFFSFNKIHLMLDATLGLINIEQNDIIKIFSVAAVIFLPPTLIASIYGMNFLEIPELKWHLGYPFAIGLMSVSAILPYLYFKKKGWL